MYISQQDDEPLEDDELPEHKRPQEQIDLSKIDPNDPESVIKLTKKGKTLMMFATISGMIQDNQYNHDTIVSQFVFSKTNAFWRIDLIFEDD